MSEAICPYTPTQGGNKGVRCLLPRGHAGGHIHDPAKAPAPTDDGEPSSFTAEELAGAIAEDEIQRRAQALDDARGIWERAADRSRTKHPCTECTGNGLVFSGSLGDACPTCHGTRVVYDDGEDDLPMPDFRALADPLHAYGDALVWRRNGRMVALPPADSVPTMEAITALRDQGRQIHRQLTAAAGGRPAPALPASAPQVRRGLLSEEGIEATADDGEIDAIEAEIVGETRGRR